MGSGMTDDIYRNAYEHKAAYTPIFVAPFDTADFVRIDVRQVKTMFPDRQGQVIIAYKQPKTAEVENQLMIKAVEALAGVSADLSSIEKNRADDLARRIAVWEECAKWDREECREN